MTLAVKLAALIEVLALSAFAVACTKTVPSAPAGPPSPVGTAELRAADLEAAEPPRVGKPQHEVQPGDALESDAEPVPKEDPPRRLDRRPGGGFSGYK
jgi:hypothetical protein